VQYRRPRDYLLPPPSRLTSLAGIRIEYHKLEEVSGASGQPLTAAAKRKEPIVKCIRANLMLDWLSRRHGWKVVLLVRHPGAVVESQLRLRRGPVWDPEPVLNRYRSDAHLHELTKDRYRRLLSRHLSTVEALAVNWVIENQWAMEQARESGVTVVFYEQLKASPGREWSRVCRTLGLSDVPSAPLIGRPSQQSSDPRASSLVRESRSLDGTRPDPPGHRTHSTCARQAHFAGYSMSSPGPLCMSGSSGKSQLDVVSK